MGLTGSNTGGPETGPRSAQRADSGSQEQSGVSLQELLQTSEAAEFRNGLDAAKSFSMDEGQLEAMPKAAQPAQLQATLLPYQLQVMLSWVARLSSSLLISCRAWLG